MRIACRGVENSSGMITRLKVYEGELEDLKRDLRNAQHLVNPDARKMLIGDDFDDDTESSSHKHHSLVSCSSSIVFRFIVFTVWWWEARHCFADGVYG